MYCRDSAFLFDFFATWNSMRILRLSHLKCGIRILRHPEKKNITVTREYFLFSNYSKTRTKLTINNVFPGSSLHNIKRMNVYNITSTGMYE